MKRAMGFCVALAMILPGCTKAPSSPSVEAPGTRGTAESRESSTVEHDLGVVLSRDEPIRHVFSLTNPTNRPIRLLRAEAVVPCCSAIEQQPESIPPGGRVELPVTFHPGHESGRRRVAFTVETDNPSRPVLTFSLAATLVVEVEVRPVDGSDSSLPLGQPGTQRFAVTCRRNGRGGLGAPDSVVAAQPLVASFVGSAEERFLNHDWIETTRMVEVTLPPAHEEGGQRGELILKWKNGRSVSQGLSWTVTPRIRASPSGFILGGSEPPGPRSILVRSDDRPFRILAVTGDALIEPVKDVPTEAGLAHPLELALRTRPTTNSLASDIRITTDHPEQPQVTLSVLALPGEQGGGP